MGKHFRQDLWNEMEANSERRRILSYINQVYEGSAGQRLVTYLEFLTVTLFAIIGTQVAGRSGMNVIGAVYVGAVSSTGGATLNDMMLGNTRGGVFWMKDRRFLGVAIGASLATFYLW